MTQSFYDITTAKTLHQFVSGFTGLSMGRSPLPAVTQVGSYDGSIGVASTAVDLAKLGTEMLRQVNHLNPKIVSDQSLFSFPVIAGPGGVLFNKEPVKFEINSNGQVVEVRIAEGKIFKKLK